VHPGIEVDGLRVVNVAAGVLIDPGVAKPDLARTNEWKRAEASCHERRLTSEESLGRLGASRDRGR
ncbi:MAG: hypothetical protein PHQ91_14705, partial [Thermoanaerobaculaceae bacterium]|nr:hypothetical protein [Thermoanaerobaculaceae bacterium]